MTTSEGSARQGKRRSGTVHVLARTDRSTKPIAAEAALMEAPPPVAVASIDAKPVGCVDGLSFQVINGWAWDPARPDEPVAVEILDGDRVVLELTADMFRPDLQKSGLGNGCHAFVVNDPATLFGGSRHHVRVRRKGDVLPLRQGEDWISRVEAGFDSIAAETFARGIAATIESARTADALEQPLSTVLDAVNLLVAARVRLDADRPEGARHMLASLAERTTLSNPMRDLLACIQQSMPPLCFEQHASPKVSIVIPVHGEFPTTYNCMKAVLDVGAQCGFEVIIVDDCSPDETILASLVFTGGCRIVRNPSNLAPSTCRLAGL